MLPSSPLNKNLPLLAITPVGSFPKPDQLKIPDWFHDTTSDSTLFSYQKYLDNPHTEEEIRQGLNTILQQQENCGFDIVTDGEIKRDNYIYYQCRLLDGFSFQEDHLEEKICRDGAYTARVPVINGPIGLKKCGYSQVVKDWQQAQALTKKPVKMTLPGPMTIWDTVSDKYYSSPREACQDLASVLYEEVQALALAGCQQIQIDDPVLTRHPDWAVEWGISALEKVLVNLEAYPNIQKTVHICRGYVDQLDSTDYKKADPNGYSKLVEKLDKSPVIDAVSLEDASHHNPLSLFEKFKQTKILLGSIQVNKSVIETPEQIEARLREVLTVVPLDRLQIAPDCGLGMLPIAIIKQKMLNLNQAVNKLRQEFDSTNSK